MTEGVTDMVVRFSDGSVSTAHPVFVWKEKDIALITTSKPGPPGLPERALPLRAGEPVIVIGYPLADKLGFSQVSVTQGVPKSGRAGRTLRWLTA